MVVGDGVKLFMKLPWVQGLATGVAVAGAFVGGGVLLVGMDSSLGLVFSMSKDACSSSWSSRGLTVVDLPLEHELGRGALPSYASGLREASFPQDCLRAGAKGASLDSWTAAPQSLVGSVVWLSWLWLLVWLGVSHGAALLVGLATQETWTIVGALRAGLVLCACEIGQGVLCGA